MKFFGKDKSDKQSAETMTPVPMTPDRMEAIVKSVDANAQISGPQIMFHVGAQQVVLVYDVSANRMRLMSPAAQLADIPEGVFKRMLQANFDTMLDCRYSIAGDLIWSAFLHPLGSLTETDLRAAIEQTVNGAMTFGTAYTSGQLIYGGGDSGALNEGDEPDNDMSGSKLKH